MRHAIAAVLALLVLGGTARAQLPSDAKVLALIAQLKRLDGWTALSSGRQGVYYIRKPKGAADIAAGRFWLRVELFEPTVNNEGSFRSATFLVESRCATYEYRYTEATLYRQLNLIDGTAVNTPDATWGHAPPGSMVETALELVCPPTAPTAH